MPIVKLTTAVFALRIVEDVLRIVDDLAKIADDLPGVVSDIPLTLPTENTLSVDLPGIDSVKAVIIVWTVSVRWDTSIANHRIDQSFANMVKTPEYAKNPSGNG